MTSFDTQIYVFRFENDILDTQTYTIDPYMISPDPQNDITQNGNFRPAELSL